MLKTKNNLIKKLEKNGKIYFNKYDTDFEKNEYYDLRKNIIDNANDVDTQKTGWNGDLFDTYFIYGEYEVIISEDMEWGIPYSIEIINR